jgi:cysteine-rich repeat protein
MPRSAKKNLAPLFLLLSPACFDLGEVPPVKFCGDFLIDGAEECDDGNIVNGDGCSSVCLNENLTCDGSSITPDALAYCNEILNTFVDPINCQDTGPTPQDFCNVKFREEVMPIMTSPQSCGNTASCHGNDPAPQGFRVDINDPALTLQNMLAVSTGFPKGVPPLNRMQPFDPEASYVIHKVLGDQTSVGGVGVRMPFLGTPLCPDDIATLCFWAAEGAVDDP